MRGLLVKHRGGPTHLANPNGVRLPCLWPDPFAHCFSHERDGPPALFRRGREGVTTAGTVLFNSRASSAVLGAAADLDEVWVSA